MQQMTAVKLNFGSIDDNQVILITVRTSAFRLLTTPYASMQARRNLASE